MTKIQSKGLVLVLMFALLPFLSFARKFTCDKISIEDYPFEVKIDKVQLGFFFLVHVTVTNKSDSAVNFTTDDFEILNPENGVAYYSVSRDKNVISVPWELQKENIIGDAKINPSRSIKGAIWFDAQLKDYRKLKYFEIHYRKHVIKVSS